MNGSKRKQLAVPMVALMVCAVAFIGIGYALQAEFTTTSNTTTGGELSIDMTYADGSRNSIFIDRVIPYAVKTTNGNSEYYTSGECIIFEGEVRITDKTGINPGNYNLSASIEKDDSPLTIAGKNVSCSFSNVTSSGSDTYKSTLTIKIDFGSNTTINDVNSLNITDIVVTVTATPSSS